MAAGFSHRHTSSAAPLAVAYSALVLYASLFPFNGWRWPPGQTAWALLALPWPPWRDPFDLWANSLGYLPLGLLLMLALSRGVRNLPSLLLVVVVSASLSFVAEVTQNFLPGRHPSLKDVAMNVAGAAAGAMSALALRHLGATARWHTTRERWFVARSGGTLALLALWPCALLSPTPLPLGLGQVGELLRETLETWLRDVPWADALHAMVIGTQAPTPLRPLSEGLATALGLLAPCMLAFSVALPGWRRVGLTLGALLLAFGAMTLSTLLNFGPHHALAWLSPTTLPALLVAALFALILAPISRRMASGLGLMALAGGLALVAQAPVDPYFAQSLQAWERGRFVHFHGMARWLGWLWPYLAITSLLARLGRRD